MMEIPSPEELKCSTGGDLSCQTPSTTCTNPMATWLEVSSNSKVPSLENSHVGSSSVTVNGSSGLSYEQKPSAEKKVKNDEGAEGETWRNDEVGLRLRVLKQTEDNLYQQAELMRTNNHNRDAIRNFCTSVNRLVDEHRDLETFLRSHAPDSQARQR